jgi:hypothetical protein
MEHLSENAISELVAGACSPADRDQHLAHLHECESCFDDYTLAVRVHAGELPYGGSTPGVDELVRLGRVEGTRGRKGTGNRWWFPLVAATALAAAVVLTVLLAPTSPYPVPGSQDLAIHDAMTDLSSRGYLVMPSTESAFTAEPPTMRSAPNANRRSFESTLTRQNRENPERVFWEVGRLMSEGGYLTARRVSEEALELSPGDRRLMHLNALAAYYDGDRDACGAQLERILEKYPDDATALVNLAVVMQESGRSIEAAELLERAADAAADEPLRERALWLLSTFRDKGETLP